MSHQHNLGPGPIAPENNPPINPQYFQPRMYFISNIAFGATTTVTTSVDHDYVIGQEVRLLIPAPYGARRLNEQLGFVISVPATNQVVLTIDSKGVDPFVSSPTYGTTRPQILSTGDLNTGYINPTGRSSSTTNIPGSFINISPL